MSSYEHVLALPPDAPRALELWLQHAAGFLLFEDVRGYALGQLDTSLDPVSAAAARKAIDDTLYGLMMVLDGVTGAISNATHVLSLQSFVRLSRRDADADENIAKLDLQQGDGFCMAYHQWLENDFGDDPVVIGLGRSKKGDLMHRGAE